MYGIVSIHSLPGEEFKHLLVYRTLVNYSDKLTENSVPEINSAAIQLVISNTFWNNKKGTDT